MAVVQFSNIPTKLITRIPTKYECLNEIYGGGLPVGMVSTWAGESGVGKTRLMLDLCAGLTNAGYRVLYSPNEMWPEQFKQTAAPFNVKQDNFWVSQNAERDLEVVVNDIYQVKPDVVVIDSLTMLEGFGGSGTLGVMDKFKHIANDIPCHIILFAQFTTDGKTVAGGAKAVYNADVVCKIHKRHPDESVTEKYGDGFFSIEVEKSRCGASGGWVAFYHDRSTKGIQYSTSSCDKVLIAIKQQIKEAKERREEPVQEVPVKQGFWKRLLNV